MLSWVRSGPLGVGDALGLGVGWLPDVVGLGLDGREDLHALEEQLDARAVQAGDDLDRVVLRVELDDRERVAGEADDQVDVVAGLDHRADAGHRRRPGRTSRAGPRGPRTVSRCRRSSGVVIWAPFVTDWRAIWPTTWLGSGTRPRGVAPAAGSRVVSIVFRDRRAEGDVLGGDDGADRRRRRRSRRWCRRRRRPPSRITIRTNATTAKNTPMSRIRRLERFKVESPGSRVTGGTTVAPRTRPRDYTKGLGPLGRIRQETVRAARWIARLPRAAVRPAAWRLRAANEAARPGAGRTAGQRGDGISSGLIRGCCR